MSRRLEVVGDLPTCHAAPALLKQVWANLLGKAFKYTRNHDPARVEVGCVEQEAARVYFVRDTGAGFDVRYAGKLLGVFQRMQKDADYDGTRVGLAIVRKVARRHGGRVWAEAAVNPGCDVLLDPGGPPGGAAMSEAERAGRRVDIGGAAGRAGGPPHPARPGGDDDRLPRGAGSGRELGAGGQQLHRQAARLPPVRCGRAAGRHVLAAAQPAAPGPIAPGDGRGIRHGPGHSR